MKIGTTLKASRDLFNSEGNKCFSIDKKYEIINIRNYPTEICYIVIDDMDLEHHLSTWLGYFEEIK